MSHAAFEIHPDAMSSFVSKIEALLPLIHELPLPKRNSTVPPDLPIAETIKEEDVIGDVTVSEYDPKGKQTAILVGRAGKAIGLDGKGFRDLSLLAEKIQRTAALREHVSVEFILGSAFAWLIHRACDHGDTTFSAWLISRLESEVTERDILIPVFGLYLQTTLSLGRCQFETIRKAQFDDLEARLTEKTGDADKTKHHVNGWRKQFQATTAINLRLLAEEKHGTTTAFGEAERAIALLRFFHPANATPYFRSYCALAGYERLTKRYFFSRHDGVLFPAEAVVPKGDTDWRIDAKRLELILASGLRVLEAIFAKSERDRTDLEAKLLECLFLYSRNALYDDIEDRLVYIFASLESMLLRNENEPISKNLGERIAFLVGQNVSERVDIVDNVTEVYKLRSRMVHHGMAIKDLDSVERFMTNAWKCLMVIVNEAQAFKTKDDMIAALERRKLT